MRISQMFVLGYGGLDINLREDQGVEVDAL